MRFLIPITVIGAALTAVAMAGKVEFINLNVILSQGFFTAEVEVFEFGVKLDGSDLEFYCHSDVIEDTGYPDTLMGTCISLVESEERLSFKLTDLPNELPVPFRLLSGIIDLQLFHSKTPRHIPRVIEVQLPAKQLYYSRNQITLRGRTFEALYDDRSYS